MRDRGFSCGAAFTLQGTASWKSGSSNISVGLQSFMPLMIWFRQETCSQFARGRRKIMCGRALYYIFLEMTSKLSPWPSSHNMSPWSNFSTSALPWFPILDLGFISWLSVRAISRSLYLRTLVHVSGLFFIQEYNTRKSLNKETWQ